MSDTVLDRHFKKVNRLARVHWDTSHVNSMCTLPPDAWEWQISFFGEGMRNFDNLPASFSYWNTHSPLSWRCYVFSKVDYADDVRSCISGLAIETADLGRANKLNLLLNRYRPSFLPSFRGYLARGFSAYSEAGSWDAMCEQAALALQHEAALTPAETETAPVVLAKSARLMDNVVGAGSSAAFLAGSELTFKGKRYSFVVSKGRQDPLFRSVRTQRPCIPYSLELRTRGGEELATGCIYFAGTPMLDQVAALKLHVASGNERAIIRTAHWSQRTELFDHYVDPNDYPPLLRKIQRDRYEITDRMHTQRNLDRADQILPKVKEELFKRVVRAGPDIPTSSAFENWVGDLFNAAPQ